MKLSEKKKTALGLAVVIILLTVLVYFAPVLNKNWGASATVLILIGIGAFLVRFERSRFFAKEIAVLSSLSAFASLTRIPFVFLPNVQPATFIIVVSGYVFGAQTGFLVGVFTTLVSNIFLGHGPWTPWQMMAWGLAGMSGALLKKIRPKAGKAALAVFCGLWGYLFGLLLNIYQWTAYVYPLNIKTYLLTYAAGFPFDSLHALGNVLFAWFFGDFFLKALGRFKKKMEISYITEELPERKIG